MDNIEGNIIKTVSENEDKSVTSQVLEYYKHHSQNRELPKYFRGSTQDWQLLPGTSTAPITINICTRSQQLQLNDIPKITVKSVSPPSSTCSLDEQKEIPKAAIENTCAPSPTSSVTSNRKLEWDNGADIGYSHSNIRHFQKSISLPTLIDGLELEKLRTTFKNNQKKQSEDMDVDAKFYISTSESTESSRKGYILSSPSSGSHQEFLSDSDMCRGDRLKDLNSNVGLPIAASTPLVDGYCFTPQSKKNDNLESQIDLNMVDKISRYKNMKVLKLAVSKTIMVECAGATEPMHGKNKLVQTSPQCNPSIAVQTDFDCTDCHIIKPSAKSSDSQNVFYVCFNDSDKETSATPCSTIQTQTNSVEESNCDSFEYHDGANYLQPENKVQDLAQQNLSPEDRQLDEEVEHSPLSTLLKEKLGGNNIKELQRNMDLLQKLINSRKYDSATKKHYVKKIIQRIIDNKNSSLKSQSDSSESNSKKGILSKQNVPESSDKNNTLSNRSDSDAKTNSFCNQLENDSPHSTKTKSPENKLDQLAPDNDDSIVKAPIKKENSKTKLGVKSFSNDYFASEPTNNGRLKRSPLLTLTAERKPYNQSDRSEITSVSQQKAPSQGSSSSLKESENENKHRSKNYNSKSDNSDFTSVSQRKRDSTSSLKESESEVKHRNWRNSKTNSEIHLEQKIGDFNYPILNYAQKERDNQLYWINNEIVHLNKLKKILETDKMKKPNIKLEEMTKNPRVEDMKCTKKATTVYVLSTERDKCPCPNRKPSPKEVQHLFKDSVLEIDDQTINLDKAELVANEEFNYNTDDTNYKTKVRRYTFEVPFKSDCKTPREVCQKSDSISSKSKGSDYFCKCSPKAPIIMTEKPCSCCATKASRLTKQLVLKDEIRAKVSTPSIRDVDTRRNIGYVQAKADRQPDSPDRIGISRKTSPIHEHVSRDTSPIRKYEGKSKPPDLASRKESPIESRSDEAPGPTRLIPPIQTHVSRNQASVQTQRESPLVSRNESPIQTLEPSVQTRVDASSDSVGSQLCPCCKEQTADRRKSANDNDRQPINLLCYPCFQNRGNHDPIYFAQNHICTCLGISKTIHKLKNTITQLENLDSETQLCKCDDNENRDGAEYCSKCKCRLKPRYRRRKGGMAYSVVLEPDQNLTKPTPCPKMESLQSIKIKIPSSRRDYDIVPCRDKEVGTDIDKRDQALQARPQIRDAEVQNDFGEGEKKKKYRRKDGGERLQDIKIKISSRKVAECQCSSDSSSSINKSGKGSCKCTCDPKKCCKGVGSDVGSVSTDESKREINVQVPQSRKKRSNKPNYKQGLSKCTCCASALSDSGSVHSGEVSSEKEFRKPREDKTLSLQDYLRKNKPHFVHSADRRRNFFANLASQRGCQNMKSKQALTTYGNTQYKNYDTMFSTKEMKKITAKNYRRCVEVQQKLINVKEMETKRSNRLLYDIFNKKLQEQVLRGKHTLPLGAAIINLW